MPSKQHIDNGTESLKEAEDVELESRPRGVKAVCIQGVKDNTLVLATLGAVLVGVGLGLAVRHAEPSDDLLMWLGLPGQLFLRGLSGTIVPLIVCMVITSTTRLEPSKNGKVAVVGLCGFLLSHLSAALVAVCCFYIFKPDATLSGEAEKFTSELTMQDVFADLIRNLIPNNIVTATFQQASTKYIEVETSNTSSLANTTRTLKRTNGTEDSTNILGIIVICAAIGIAANKVLSPDSEFLRFFYQGQQVIFVITRWLFLLTPVGVVSLIMTSIAEVDSIKDVLEQLGVLVGSVTSSLAVHQLVVWPLVILLVTRRNPFSILAKCIRPYVISFAATATSIAIPDMLISCEKCGVSQTVRSVIIPMSVALHADGSAAYIAGSALFLTQISCGGVTVENVIVIVVLTSVLCLAIPSVPSSSIVTLTIILTSVNCPLDDVGLLFAVEWLLDRLRSGVNAVGHVLVAVIADVTENGHIQEVKTDDVKTDDVITTSNDTYTSGEHSLGDIHELETSNKPNIYLSSTADNDTYRYNTSL